MRLHLVSHTHWDREWFLPSAYTREWLPPFFDSLFALLERKPEYQFTLDGQTILIEDYLEELAHGDVPPQLTVRDSKTARTLLKRHAAAGRITLGPYYLQPDWNLVSGESLVRNLQIGHTHAREYAEPMKAGWLLDNFGQIGQCPQIHRGFGITSLLFWRGLNVDPQRVRTELVWRSPDGSEVGAVYLIDSYRNAMQLLAHPPILERRVRYAADRGKRFSETGQILLMNGYDQEMEPEDVLPALAALRTSGLNIHQVRPQQFFTAVRDELGEPSAPSAPPVIHGEQYNGRYISVFPGVLSARVYLKQANHRAETLLERYLEPIAALAAIRGVPFPHPELAALWRKVLRNHPHDSICGVGVDDVHTDMEHRFARIQEHAEHLLRERLQTAAEATPNDAASPSPSLSVRRHATAHQPAELHVAVFNPLPEPRSELVTVRLPWMPADTAHPLGAYTAAGDPLPAQALGARSVAVAVNSLPPTGFSHLTLRPADTGAELVAAENAVSAATTGRGVRLKNRHLVVTVATDGTLTIRSRSTGCEYGGLLCYEDGGDVGDTYSYCAPTHDRILLSSGKTEARLELAARGPLRAVCRISQVLEVPAAAANSRTTRSPETEPIPIITEVTLDRDSPMVQLRATVRNRARDHRLRILFPFAAETIVAGSTFDVVQRPAIPAQYHDDEIPAALKQMLLGAREPDPITTLPFRGFVAAEARTNGLAVLARGLYEYEYLPTAPNTEAGGALALTLLRSVGWLARSDLTSRTGDAGPLIATPDAQCLRDLVFELALYAYQGPWAESGLPALSDRFSAPPLAALGSDPASVTQQAAGEAGLVTVSSLQHIVRTTAVTLARSGEAILVRCCNPSAEAAATRIHGHFAVSRATRTNLAEDQHEDLLVRDNTVHLKIAPHAVETVMLYPKAQLRHTPPPGNHTQAHVHDREPAHTSAPQPVHQQAQRHAEAGRFDLVGALELQADGAYPLTEPLDPTNAATVPEGFAAHPPVEVVHPEELEREKARLTELTRILATRRRELAASDIRAVPEPSAGASDRSQHLKAAISTLERTILEAELSVRMLELKQRQHAAGKRLPLPHDEDTRQFFRDVGYQLNQARIKKRTDDYLCDLIGSDQS